MQIDLRKKRRIVPIGIAVLAIALLAAFPLYTPRSSPVQAASAQPVTLGTAANFAVLAGTTVTNTGPTVVTGDLGVDPGSACTGFQSPCTTPHTGTVDGAIHTADAVALQAQTDNAAAYLKLKGESCTKDYSGTDLGGLTLTPGVYCFSSSAQLTGTLTLNMLNNPSSVFIFQIGSKLTTASESSVAFINGANPCNVYWQVTSSATLGTTTHFAGNILALTSITLNNGANVSGRVLAQTGTVTMDSNYVSTSACGTSTSTTSQTSTSTTSESSTSSTTSTTSESSSSSTNTSVPSTVYLTVEANGSHFVDIWANGVMTSSGFTPVPLAVTAGQAFTVGAFDNGCYRFSHWTDGSTQRFRNMTIMANMTLTAVYTNTCLPLQAGYSNINITTVDSSGSAISGYYTTLWQNGALNQSCFSSCSFAVAPGTYQVAVSDFGGMFFNHWTDNSTNRLHTVIVGSSSSNINLTAVFGTTATESALGSVPSVSTATVSSTMFGGAAALGIIALVSISAIFWKHTGARIHRHASYRGRHER